MRLSKLRLAGFKSFVDPTTLEFRSNLTGIVGPNGCGKSNTIDAVRWVMGESSAKQLRGASMEDVIFNGAATRKPVGVASVELIFDNSDGRLGGGYAQYAEIAIKRQVSRDGESRYFLNGQRCRRRDITDIFLGTGLGPRSYAIIEQGMIARLIEAKPEELRHTLEEAAGISRYKERRRETETRMAHTRENLERLNDLRDELGKQLERLDKQAQAAQRFRTLRARARELEAGILLLQWQAIQTEATQQQRALGAATTAHAGCVATLRQVEAQLEELRSQHGDASEALHTIQGEHYQLGAEIARLEQAIQHQRELQRRQQAALQQLEQELAAAQKHVDADHAQAQQAAAALANLEPQQVIMAARLEEADMQLAAAEEAWQAWQEQWHSSQQNLAEPTRQAQVEKARIEQLERQLHQLAQRRTRLQQETASHSDQDWETQAEQQAAQLAETATHLAAAEEQLAVVEEELAACQTALTAQQAALDVQRTRRQALQGQEAALTTLQQASIGKTDAAQEAWLQAQGWGTQPRLATMLKIKQGWEAAFEVVLADAWDAVLVDAMHIQGELPPSQLTVVEHCTATPYPLAEAFDSQPCVYLASKVHAPEAVRAMVAGIRCAENLREALAKRQTLGVGESIVTRDGIWLGRNWLRVRRQGGQQGGILQRQQELAQLQQELSAVEVQLAETEQHVADLMRQQHRLGQQRQQAQTEVNRLHRQASEQRGQWHSLQQRAAQFASRQRQLAEELAELEALQAQTAEELEQATAQRNAALALLEEAQRAHASLEAQRQARQQALQAARHVQRDAQQALHRLQVQLAGQHQQHAESLRQLERSQARQAALEQQYQEQLAQLAQHTDPTAPLQESLQAALAQRNAVEQQLSQARKAVQESEATLRQHDQRRLQAEQAVGQARSTLENGKLAWQALQVREQTLAEQFAKTEYSAAELQAKVAGADAAAWQAELEQVQRNIQRLGAVNLAAIEEFQEAQTRKQHLDQQYEDLTAALETLESAIRKIDRATRARFKETFDWVNGRLGEMFPRLFGGGECYLEMTEDDLLTTGIAIMARPPGKKISSIHLLSGGEKALTALALVFAIFELNPAPFCLLDEVDAPLDEANVGRFCELVRRMAERVQFIFITHNKTTMELAEQLVGVTMREAGVSRLVAVDIAEAVRLANA